MRIKKIKQETAVLRRIHDLGTAVYRGEEKMPFRKLVCGKYVAFYRILGDEIEIVRIFDGRQNWQRKLFN